jgi:undecaprenyl-diphosphatase
MLRILRFPPSPFGEIMPLWHAVLLGIVQGLTEFLPVSSTAHLLLAQQLLGYSMDELKDHPFTVVIQIGTLFAVLFYFRHDILDLVRGFFLDLYENRIVTSATPAGRMAKYVIVGTIPVVVCGLLLKKPLREHFYNPTAIAVVQVVFAGLMAAAELRRRGRTAIPREVDDINIIDAVLIGLAQALALMPGASRSGCTLTAGLFLGLGRPAAARFSFVLSLPAVFAAGVKDLYDWLSKPGDKADLAMPLIVGTLVSAVVGYAAIAWLMRYLGKSPLWWFVVYRVLLAVAILAVFAV